MKDFYKIELFKLMLWAKEEYKIKDKDLDKLKLKFNLKSKKVLGLYSYNKKTIYLNKRTIKDKNGLSILIHEFAHFIQRELDLNTQAHGKEWRAIMKKLGVKNPRAKTAEFNDLLK